MNVLGIWDGHDSGAALLQDGRLRFAVNEERLTRRKLEVRFPTRSIEACLASPVSTPEQIDLVAVSTFDPAKTIGRWWRGSKERYYAVRRRQARPGPLAELTRALKYRMTEWPPGPISHALSRRALRGPLAQPRALARASSRLVDHHEAHAAAAAWAVDLRALRGGDDRRRRRRPLVDDLDRSATAGCNASPRRRRAARSACSSSTSPTCSTCASSKTKAR